MFGGAAFGGNAFAQQFGGGGAPPPAGGFLATTQTQHSPGKENENKGRQEGQNSVMPVTVLMIHRAAQQLSTGGPDTKITIFGQEIRQMSFCGIVTAKTQNDEGSPYVELMVDDGTAQIPCRKYYDQECAEEVNRYENGFSVNNYVKVVGAVRNFQTKYWVACFSLVLASHVDDIVHGFTQVLQVKKRIQKAATSAGGHAAAFLPGASAASSAQTGISKQQLLRQTVIEIYKQNGGNGDGLGKSDAMMKIHPQPDFVDVFQTMNQLVEDGMLRHGRDDDHLLYCGPM